MQPTSAGEMSNRGAWEHSQQWGDGGRNAVAWALEGKKARHGWAMGHAPTKCSLRSEHGSCPSLTNKGHSSVPQTIQSRIEG